MAKSIDQDHAPEPEMAAGVFAFQGGEMATPDFFRDDVEQVATLMDDMAGSTLDPHYRAAKMLWHFAKQCPQVSDMAKVPDKKPREVV